VSESDGAAFEARSTKGETVGLQLVELELSATTRAEVLDTIGQVAKRAEQAGGSLLESQITSDLARAYVVLEGDACAELTIDPSTLDGVASLDGPHAVRLVGATIDEVRAAGGGGEYLVEWDIPAEVTLEQYLARKKEKSPLYAQVPEVSFLRTYVREDVDKCLCFYDGPDEAAVRHAREVVQTPVSRLHTLSQSE